LSILEQELRRDIVRFGRWISRLGHTPGTAGNLSVRLDQERLLATPTGMSKALMKPCDIVITDLRGKLLSGPRNVTSEIGMHVAIYDQRPNVQAVIHSHPPIATAFACAGRALDEVLCQESIMTLGVVPLARYATTGTDEVGASLSPHIATHDAILLANHGAVTCGRSLLDAFMKMETIEHLARVALVAHQLGSAQPLRGSQIERLHRARESYVSAAKVNGLSVEDR
jgi:L-fuculose-phosphate aldolase